MNDIALNLNSNEEIKTILEEEGNEEKICLKSMDNDSLNYINNQIFSVFPHNGKYEILGDTLIFK